MHIIVIITSVPLDYLLTYLRTAPDLNDTRTEFEGGWAEGSTQYIQVRLVPMHI